MKNRFMFVLPLLLVTTACAIRPPRYTGPTDFQTKYSAEVACAYQAHKANRWEDDAFQDACMSNKGYVVNEGTPVHWYRYPRSNFIEYDAKRQPAR